MSQAGKRVVAKTVSTRDFTAALAQNAAIFLSLDVKALGVGENVDCLLRAVQIVSVEDLDWDLWFFRKTGAAGNSANPDTNSALGQAVLATSVRIGAVGLFAYYLEDLEIPIYDEDRTSKVHLALINRAAGGKSAGVAGGIVVSLVLEPTLGI